MLALKSLLTIVGTTASILVTYYVSSPYASVVDNQVSLSQAPIRDEIVVTPRIEPKEEIVYVDRLTLEKELAGVRRKNKPLKAVYKPIENYFGKPDVIKSGGDRNLWYEFVRDFGGKTDEDTLESACKHYSKKLVSYFENKQWLKGKIRDYCFVKIGFKL